MAVLALRSFFESLDPERDEDAIADLLEIVERLPRSTSSVPLDHPLRAILRPYLQRYYDLMSEEYRALPAEDEDGRADVGEVLQFTRALLALKGPPRGGDCPPLDISDTAFL